MEGVKKLLDQNEASFISSSDENDSDNESFSAYCSGSNLEDFSCLKYLLEVKSSNSITKKRNGEKRMPTRKPDPNVYNRNALLARENRRKKKVYLETIEKELQVVRKANTALAKALKRQLKISQRLEKEKRYFERLLTNRADVFTLVNALNFHHVSESEERPFSTNNELYIDEYINGTSTGSLSSSFQEAEASTEFENPSNDLDETDNSLSITSVTWDDLLGVKEHNIDSLISSNMSQNSHDVQRFNNDDHCYVMPSTVSRIATLDKKSESSDYIDVEADSVQIETFESSCNWNPACGTPPLQLLSDQPT